MTGSGFYGLMVDGRGSSKDSSCMPVSFCLANLFLIFFLLISSGDVSGQYYIRGQDPASVDWKQIETRHFLVIFPEEFSEQASYVADILEFSYEPVASSLGHRPRRVPVILHNQTVVPNGFVSWAPSRIEMFSNPPPDNDAHGWLERLAVHEFRHVVQVDKLNQGVTGVAARIFGEHVTGLALGVFVPQWFLEGDAVAAETAFTHGGRGRLPAFERGLRAQVLEKEIYSYDKATLGSYKNHVPNHYELGYQLTAAARALYGIGVWDDVLNYVTHRPHTIIPFSLGLREHAGVSVRAHYDSTFSMLEAAWKHQKEQHTYTSFDVINRKKDIYTHYRPLAILDDTSLLVLKSGFEDIPKIIRLSLHGEEEDLFTPGPGHREMFSLGDSLLAWTEIRHDARWEHRSWSEVHTWCLRKERVRRITRGTRYFAASVSPCDSLIAVSEVSPVNEYSLVVIDASSGEEVFRVSDPGNAYLMQPSWHPEKNSLTAVAQDDEGKRIVLVNLDDHSMKTLFDAGYTDISRPRYLGAETIVFHGAFSGIDNIYHLDVENGRVSKVISSHYGAYDLLFHEGENLYAWSDYTAKGFQAVMRKEKPDKVTPLQDVENHAVNFYRHIVEQEPGDVVSGTNITRHDHEIRNYSRLANLFRFHSWGPFTVDVDAQDVDPGVSVFSQNNLSTSLFSAGYAFDINDRLGKYYIDYRYMGWYPMVDLRGETGLRRSYYLDQSGSDDFIPFLFRERSVKVGLNLPMRFQRGTIHYGVTPSAAFRMIGVRPDDDSPDFFRGNDIYPFEYRLTAYWQRRMVQRDIRPRWGHVLDLQYRHTLLQGGDMGAVLAGRFTAFFPGLARHHSLRLSAAWQEHEPGATREFTINYRFPNLINYPRGYTARYDERLWVLSADYALPVMYPEWKIPYAFYIKRVYLNLFGDYAGARRPALTDDGDRYLRDVSMYSMGADVLANMHFLGIFTPVQLGLRTAWMPDEAEVAFRLLFNITL